MNQYYQRSFFFLDVLYLFFRGWMYYIYEGLTMEILNRRLCVSGHYSSTATCIAFAHDTQLVAIMWFLHKRDIHLQLSRQMPELFWLGFFTGIFSWPDCVLNCFACVYQRNFLCWPLMSPWPSLHNELCNRTKLDLLNSPSEIIWTCDLFYVKTKLLYHCEEDSSILAGLIASGGTTDQFISPIISSFF